MSNDIDEQIEILKKESEKARLERDAAISKATDEKALIELEGQKALAQAEHKKALIDLEKQTAEAQRDAFAARLPITTITPLDGDTTIGANTGYLAELVAYQAIRRAAQKAADDICQRLKGRTPKPRILIVATLDLASATTALDLLFSQIGQWQAMLQAQMNANQSLTRPAEPPDTAGTAEGTAKPLAPIAGILPVVMPTLAAIGPAVSMAGSIVTAASSLVGAAASVAALFRTDYSVTGRELSFKQEIAQSQLAHALSEFEIAIHGFQPEATSGLLVCLQDCFRIRIELAKSVALLSVRADAKPAGVGAGEAEEIKNALKGAVQASTTLFAGWDQFVASLTTPAASGPAPLTSALAAEQLRAPDITYYLYVNVASSGAESQTKKSLWRSGSITYQGGGILNYVLIERSGSVVAADAQVAMSALTMKLGDQPSGLVDSLG